MIRDLYARYYRMSVEHPLRFIHHARIVLSLAALAVLLVVGLFTT